MGKDGKLLGDVWKPLAHNGRKGLWRRGNDGGQTEDHAAKLEVVLHLRKGLEDCLENRDCLVELLVQDMESEDLVVPEGHGQSLHHHRDEILRGLTRKVQLACADC